MSLQFPSQDLTNQAVSLSYQTVVQLYTQGTASYFLDGLGNVILFSPTSFIGQQIITADQPVPLAITASYAMNGGGSGISASYATSASYAATYLVVTNATYANNSEFSQTASYVLEVEHAYTSDSASVSVFSIFSDTASLAILAEFSNTASSAIYALSASYSSMDNISQDLIPSENNTYDLGSSIKQWRDLYVSSGSIYLNQVPLSMIDGAISIGGNKLVTSQTLPELLSDPSIITTSSGSFNLFSGKGNINNYFQINIKNCSNSPSASAGFVATANDGTETSSYINMGINSSNYSVPEYDIGGVHGGYLFVDNGDLSVGTKSPSKIVKIHIGGMSKENKVVEISKNLFCLTGSMRIYSGSLEGTSSYSINSQTASYVPSTTQVEFGMVSGSSFSGTPQTYDIIYTNPFPNSIYTVSIIGDEARIWSTVNRSSTGFTINSNSNILLSEMVMWRVEG